MFKYLAFFITILLNSFVCLFIRTIHEQKEQSRVRQTIHQLQFHLIFLYGFILFGCPNKIIYYTCYIQPPTRHLRLNTPSSLAGSKLNFFLYSSQGMASYMLKPSNLIPFPSAACTQSFTSWFFDVTWIHHHPVIPVAGPLVQVFIIFSPDSFCSFNPPTDYLLFVFTLYCGKAHIKFVILILQFIFDITPKMTSKT